MLPPKIEEALNSQLNAELFSAYLYMSMAAYFESLNLTGFGNWMKVQTQEELFHAQKFFDHINARGGRVIMQAMEKPETDWESTLAVFEFTYKHEQKVTSLINDLVELARTEKDNATYNFLQWFVSEQVEEEASADAVLQKLKLVGDFGPGIFMIDQEMGQRVFTPPTAGV
ncbi:MAG: ferritin [candidate division Zixibacteria bacterium]|nr:ferritin [Candidatus Tariuqbacter arcticus]